MPLSGKRITLWYAQMNGQQLIKVSGKLHGTLRKKGTLAAQTGDEETVHKFRIGYKKLRAYLRMLCSLPQHSNKLVVSKSLKEYYAVMGDIRDHQMLQKKLQQEQPSDEVDALMRSLDVKMQIFLITARNIDIDRIVRSSSKKISNHLPAHFTYIDFENYVDHSLMQVNSQVTSGIYTDEQIHSVRKQLKDVFYNTRLFGHSETPGEQKEEKEKDHMDELLDQLGNYQDSCRSVSLLENNLQHQIPSSHLQLILSNWLAQKEEQRTAVLEKLNAPIAYTILH